MVAMVGQEGLTLIEHCTLTHGRKAMVAMR
jgi:hypothetical protein